MNNEINSRILSIRKGKIPLGYKKTKVGIIPNDWEEKNLRDLIEELETGVSVNSYDFKAKVGEKAVLKTSCINNGKFNPNENKVIVEKELNRAKLNPKAGQIIISRMNTPQLVGEIGYIEKNYPMLFLPDRLWQSKLYENVDGKWLAECLITGKIKYQIKDIATGTSNSMKNISKTSFLALKVPFTKYTEQRKIASILGLWEKRIGLKEKLLQEKQKQKKGLMERLLTGKVRLSGFNECFNKVRLDKIIEESKEKSEENNQYEILSVTKEGIFLQRDYFNRQIASEDNIGYKVVRKNNLVFSTMNLWMGSIDVLDNYDVGIVSPACKVFYLNDRLIDISFMKYFVKSSYMMNLYSLNSEQGASIVRRNLDLKGLLSSKVKLPKLEEQKQIGKILDTSTKEIELLQKEIELLKEQKKGLMQLLLTGIVRVNCD